MMKLIILCLLLNIIALIASDTTAQIKVGDRCTVETNGRYLNGTCTVLRNCRDVQTAYQRHSIKPTICFRALRLICCPDPIVQEASIAAPVKVHTTRRSASMCEDYSHIYDKYSSRIFIHKSVECSQKMGQPLEGGERATNKELPHVALLGYSVNVTEFGLLCVGALITEFYVLASAHCANNREENEAQWVILGDFVNGTRSENTLVHEIKERLKHPQYRPHSIDYDIALYKLYEEVTFNEYIIPICLPQFDDVPEYILESHWDVKRFNDIVKAPLRKNSLKIINERDCFDAHRSDDRITTGISYQTKICASSIHERQDSCWDKSGGLLQASHDSLYCMYTLVGVTALKHENCGSPDIPEVFTRVHRYIDWIEGLIYDST